MEKIIDFIERFILIISVVLVIGISSAVAVVRFSSTREGSHTGYITAIEQEGYFFPNYHVYFKTSATSGQEDIYCLRREKTVLASLMKIWSQKQQLVTLTYNGVRGIGLGQCDITEIINVVPDVSR